MMILSSYLVSNVLISNTYDIFNYDTFKRRLIARYGKRKILDLNISEIAQNAVDVNREYYASLFKLSLSPESTSGDKTIESYSENGEGNTTNEQTSTLTKGGTITNEENAENSSESKSDSITSTTSTQKNSAWAYNQTAEPSPTDQTETTQGGTSNTTYNDGGKNIVNSTQTLDTTDTNAIKGSNTNNNSKSGTRTITHTSYDIASDIELLRTRFSAYDILIDDIMPLIIDFYDFHI